MADKLLHTILADLKALNKDIIAIENNDKFLFREDVIQFLEENNFCIIIGSQLEHRIAYELKKVDKHLILLNEKTPSYISDMENKVFFLEFELTKYLNAYHIPSIVSLDFSILNKLYAADPIGIYSKPETEIEVDRIQQKINDLKRIIFNLNSLSNKLSIELLSIRKDWLKIISLVSDGLLSCIGTQQYKDFNILLDQVNAVFQDEIDDSYGQLINSSYIKNPPIVSKILDYIDFHHSRDKVALIVIDGLAYWQYLMLKSYLNIPALDNITFSWLPSITQLSRQAIFKGNVPELNYQQNPQNERLLWEKYWKEKSIPSGSILYSYENYDSSMLTGISRFALVYKDLDSKMHGSSDFQDLKSLTENWLSRSGIIRIIENIKQQGFEVFITSDHGNLESKGIHTLSGREKLGTNKSGSRSERHIEYSDEWLADDFVANNPDLESEISRKRNSIYMKNNKAFLAKKYM